MDLLDAQKKTATLLLVNEYKQTNTTAVSVPSKVHILWYTIYNISCL